MQRECSSQNVNNRKCERNKVFMEKCRFFIKAVDRAQGRTIFPTGKIIFRSGKKLEISSQILKKSLSTQLCESVAQT